MTDPVPSNKPLCFVLMPLGVKKDPVNGLNIDFDVIYEQAIRQGIEDAGMEPIRADEERTGRDANVFYALGVRDAVGSATTLSVFASHQTIPFDLNFICTLLFKKEKSSG